MGGAPFSARWLHGCGRLGGAELSHPSFPEAGGPIRVTVLFCSLVTPAPSRTPCVEVLAGTLRCPCSLSPGLRGGCSLLLSERGGKTLPSGFSAEEVGSLGSRQGATCWHTGPIIQTWALPGSETGLGVRGGDGMAWRHGLLRASSPRPRSCARLSPTLLHSRGPASGADPLARPAPPPPP